MGGTTAITCCLPWERSDPRNARPAGRIHFARGFQITGAPRDASIPWEKQQVIYKHAISTIVPERPVPLEWEEQQT
ncbi:MAG: RNA chaperone Hfq [Oscillospiraceae bacterium]|nr:RNA chaperone Hfq [Oscillospiraceae bacterium]